MRPHNPRLSRDLRMHNACGREMVQGEERAGKTRAGEREGERKGDMQAKVIRSSLQGTRRRVGEKDDGEEERTNDASSKNSGPKALGPLVPP